MAMPFSTGRLQGCGEVEFLLEQAMVAIKAHFDGKKVILPEEFRTGPPREVLVVFEEPAPEAAEQRLWLKAQESAFAKVWDNDEDSIYDSL